ncbi:tannase/feruloyl esterase family alpha/beta hydrolase [Pacificoceanicola onchidii]|uniref:tannase/feruloyl esterase family alpha/beta hydrolase n=1 Tax=Pacificoceanicola onchidii TaxID=2562685 RepID=UPI0010A33F91|nr:tannase/feruloyl esterase family alpha/beta hydrolase [Pacificoceanicola onchidii]
MKKLITALAIIGSAPAAFADETKSACSALTGTVLSAATVTSAREMTPEGLPAYCEVRATALPAINIEVRLPLEGWNGKYYQAGCGGFCGILGRADAGASWINAMRPGLERGYATATSDSGHHGLSVVDAGWAQDNPHAERDWGWRSIGETNRVAQAMIKAFYGTGSDQAIFQGCSTGGRMAHVAAQRYPEMFDGIISGAPAMDYPGLVATKMAWLVQANTAEDGSQILTAAEAGKIGAAVLDQCDAIDGQEDGVIADPRDCTVDYSNVGLTNQQMDTLMKWREGPRNSNGDQLYPGGVPEGSEPFWWLWLTGNDKGRAPLVPAFVTGFGRHMAFDDDPGVTWSPMDFDFDKDPARMTQATANYNGDNPDLTAFREAGGKMIVFHGWADAIVTPYKTVEWHEQAQEAAGGAEALADTVALFMVPGLDHCGILPGPDGINAAALDPMSPLEAWLADGTRPMSIMSE